MIEISYIDTKEIDQKLTGLAVRFAREKLGLAQGDLAKQMNCTKAYISKLELGKGNLSEKKIESITAALERLLHKQKMAEANAAFDEYIGKTVRIPRKHWEARDRAAFVAGWFKRGEYDDK